MLNSVLWGGVASTIALISLSALQVQGGIRYRDRNQYLIGFGPPDDCDGDD